MAPQIRPVAIDTAPNSVYVMAQHHCTADGEAVHWWSGSPGCAGCTQAVYGGGVWRHVRRVQTTAGCSFTDEFHVVQLQRVQPERGDPAHKAAQARECQVPSRRRWLPDSFRAGHCGCGPLRGVRPRHFVGCTPRPPPQPRQVRALSLSARSCAHVCCRSTPKALGRDRTARDCRAAGHLSAQGHLGDCCC